jgi:dTDP-4-dehydrorhamnose reductase
MNILIFGASGMAGSMITRYLSECGYNIVPMFRKDFDVLKDELPILDTYDYVINCIGLIKQRQNIDDKLFHTVNAEFPKNLATKCKRLFHISSDCVFSGNLQEDKLYSTFDKKDAQDSYGRSKSEGECLYHAMILRTSIIGPSKDNNGLFEWFRNTKEPVNGFANHLWSGITTLQLAKIIEDIISTNGYKNGLYQVSSTKISKYNLLCLINTIFFLGKDVTYYCDDFPINRSLKPDIQAPNIELQLCDLKEYMDNRK